MKDWIHDISCGARGFGIIGEKPPGDDDVLTRARVEGRIRGDWIYKKT
jgi:hypothetical protein